MQLKGSPTDQFDHRPSWRRQSNVPLCRLEAAVRGETSVLDAAGEGLDPSIGEATLKVV